MTTKTSFQSVAKDLSSPNKPASLSISVRVPVTPANREYLRALRQAELAAWRSAPGGTLCVSRKG